VRGALTRYRVMANIVGVLLIVLILVGVPLANFDGSGMWNLFPSTPGLVTEGSSAQEFGEAITLYLGTAHGWLYMIFLISAFWLSRVAEWDLGFTLVTLALGTVPIASFWAERRATRQVLATEASQTPPVA
jgi:integral membrane protein